MLNFRGCLALDLIGWSWRGFRPPGSAVTVHQRFTTNFHHDGQIRHYFDTTIVASCGAIFLARPLLRWLVFVWRAMAMTHADEFDLWMQVRDTILATCVYYWELNIDGRTKLEC